MDSSPPDPPRHKISPPLISNKYPLPDPSIPEEWLDAKNYLEDAYWNRNATYTPPIVFYNPVDEPTEQMAPPRKRFVKRRDIAKGGFGHVSLWEYEDSDKNIWPMAIKSAILSKSNDLNDELLNARRFRRATHIVPALFPDFGNQHDIIDQGAKNELRRTMGQGQAIIFAMHFYPIGTLESALRRLLQRPDDWALTVEMLWSIFQCLVKGLVNLALRKPKTRTDRVHRDDEKRGKLKNHLHLDLDAGNVLIQAFSLEEDEEAEDRKVNQIGDDRVTRDKEHRWFGKVMIADLGITQLATSVRTLKQRTDISDFGKRHTLHPEQVAAERLKSRLKLDNPTDSDARFAFFPALSSFEDAKKLRHENNNGWLPALSGNYGYRSNLYQVGLIMFSVLTGMVMPEMELRKTTWQSLHMFPLHAGKDSEQQYATHGGVLLPQSPFQLKIRRRDFLDKHEQFKLDALRVLICQCLAVNPNDRPSLWQLQLACDHFVPFEPRFVALPAKPGEDPAALKLRRAEWEHKARLQMEAQLDFYSARLQEVLLGCNWKFRSITKPGYDAASTSQEYNVCNGLPETTAPEDHEPPFAPPRHFFRLDSSTDSPPWMPGQLHIDTNRERQADEYAELQNRLRQLPFYGEEKKEAQARDMLNRAWHTGTNVPHQLPNANMEYFRTVMDHTFSDRYAGTVPMSRKLGFEFIEFWRLPDRVVPKLDDPILDAWRAYMCRNVDDSAEGYLLSLRQAMGPDDFAALIKRADCDKISFWFGFRDRALVLFRPWPAQSDKHSDEGIRYEICKFQQRRNDVHGGTVSDFEMFNPSTYWNTKLLPGLTPVWHPRPMMALVISDHAGTLEMSEGFMNAVYRLVVHGTFEPTSPAKNLDLPAKDGTTSRGLRVMERQRVFHGTVTQLEAAKRAINVGTDTEPDRMVWWNLVRKCYIDTLPFSGNLPVDPAQRVDFEDMMHWNPVSHLPQMPQPRFEQVRFPTIEQKQRFCWFLQLLHEPLRHSLLNEMYTGNMQLVFCVDKHHLDCIWFRSRLVYTSQGESLPIRDLPVSDGLIPHETHASKQKGYLIRTLVRPCGLGTARPRDGNYDSLQSSPGYGGYKTRAVGDGGTADGIIGDDSKLDNNKRPRRGEPSRIQSSSANSTLAAVPDITAGMKTRSGRSIGLLGGHQAANTGGASTATNVEEDSQNGDANESDASGAYSSDESMDSTEGVSAYQLIDGDSSIKPRHKRGRSAKFRAKKRAKTTPRVAVDDDDEKQEGPSNSQVVDFIVGWNLGFVLSPGDAALILMDFDDPGEFGIGKRYYRGDNSSVFQRLCPR